MSLVECPDCGKQVSDAAELCIHCGKPMKAKLIDADNAHFCPVCLKEGKKVLMLPSSKSKTSFGIGSFAWILIILGTLGFLLNRSAHGFTLIFLLGGILILAFGNKEKKVLECPTCKTE